MRARVPAGLVAAAALAVLLAVLPFLINGYRQGLVTKVGVYFIAILGLNILTGYTGQISIGHGAFMAIGGYTTAVMSHYHHTNLVLTLPLAFAITFGFGILVGIPALRFSGVYLALATFAFAVSVPQFAIKFSKFLGGRNGLQTTTPVTHTWLYAVTWSCAAILFAAAWFLLRGRVGRAFRAVRDSELAAVSTGVSLPIYKTLAFGISAAYAGVAGSLFVLVTNGYINSDTFGVIVSLQILIGAAVAGLGSLWGVALGAVFVGLLPEISSSAPLVGSSHGQDVVFGLIVIVVMLLLPNGAAGLLARLFRPRRA